MIYRMNGSEASVAPFEVRWNPTQTGVDHNGAPIYSRFYDIDMQFPACCHAEADQWLNNACGGSVNLTVLDRYGIDSTIVSSVYLTIVNPGAIQATYNTGFSLKVLRATV